MSDAVHDAWFYTRRGERFGPVRLSELRRKASVAELDPRLDLVWTKGMADWLPSGEVEGIFAKQSPIVSGSPSTSENGKSKEAFAVEFLAQHGDFPGASRMLFWATTVFLPLIVFGGLAAISFFPSELFPKTTISYVSAGVSLLLIVVMIYVTLQRLVNLGMSRWWFLLLLVPVANIFIHYRCLVCPPGFAFHKKLDGIGVFLAVLFWLGLLLMILSIGAGTYYLVDILGDPDFQKNLLEKLN